MSGWAISSAMLSDFTEPPYWTRTLAAVFAPDRVAIVDRISAHTACASSGVAVRPVPMAQMGS